MRIKVHLALLLVTLIYGANFTIAKAVMPELIEPFGFIVLRISTAGVFLWLFHALFIKEKISSLKDLGWIALCALFGVACNMMFFFKGLSLTTPINASIMMITTPIFVVVFAKFYLKEHISLRKGAGILIGMGGAILLLGGHNFSFSGENITGDLLVMLNATCYGIYLVLVKPMMIKYHPLTVVKWTFLFGLIYVTPFGFNEFMAVDWANIPDFGWASFAFVIVGTTFLAYLLNAWSLKYVNSSVVGAYIYLQPVFAGIIAMASGSDQFTLRKVLLSLVIFSGIYLVSVPRKLFLEQKEKWLSRSK